MNLDLDRSTWERVRFGDVVRNVIESVKDAEAAGIDRIIALEHLDPGELQISRWGDVADGTTFTKRVRPGQTLFGKRRAYQRKAAFAEFEAITSGDILVFEAIPARMLPELLPFLVQSEPFFAHALDTSAGSLSPRTNWGDLAKFEFDLPPLDEQQRIADLLWGIEADKYSTGLLVDQIKVTREAWLDSSLEKLRTRELSSITSLQNGRPVASGDYGTGSLRLLRPGDIRPYGVTEWGESSVSIPETYGSGHPEAVLERGDLVINMTAQSLEERFLGRVARVHERAYLNQRIGRFNLADRNDSDWLHLVLRSGGFAAWVATRSEGSKVKHMHWRHIEFYPVPWAEDDDRDAILSINEAWTESEQLAADRLAAAVRLRGTVVVEVFG